MANKRINCIIHYQRSRRFEHYIINRGILKKECSRSKKRKASTIIRRSKRHKGEDEGVDRISQLPNDILISIISRLNVQEATTTSILSSGWRYLHTYITHLIFPTFAPNPIENSSDLIESQHIKFLNHVDMINGVLDSHNGGGLVKELKLHMYNMEGGSMKKWLEFAFTKEIEIMDINLIETPYSWPRRFAGSYSFGLSTLILSKSSQPLLPSLKSLKQLTLVNVDVTNHDFYLLVSNFLALETLCIQQTQTLYNVSIVGHPNLKHLDMDFCWQLESFEIRNVMNLLSLRIHNIGRECDLGLENIPKLVELYTNEAGDETRWYDELFGAVLPSCICDQLQLLHLSCDLYPWGCPPLRLQPFQLVNVKQLELVLNILAGWKHAPVFLLFTLIEACLSLEKLKIKFLSTKSDVEEMKSWERKAPRYDSNVKKLSPNLKVLEIEEYLGFQSELDIAAYIINYAVNLEQVTVAPCDASDSIRLNAMIRAQEDFREITPHSIHLRIID